MDDPRNREMQIDRLVPMPTKKAPRHFVRRKPAAARRSLVKACQEAGVTLVLGAGVSVARGLPSWGVLVRDLWRELDGEHQLPAWMHGEAEAPHPLAYQIAIEELEGALRQHLVGRAKGRAKKGSRKAQGEVVLPSPEDVDHALADLVRARLYRDERPRDESDTLGLLSGLLREDQKRAHRRVVRVISFNADDLLEREVNRGHQSGSRPVLWPVTRASFHPRRSDGAHQRPPINCYHLHGFLASSKRYQRDSADTLIFTDSQYWESVERPTSFANRIMSIALQDSHCVFLGLSMTDVNLMRWLGLRQVEFVADRRNHYQLAGHAAGEADKRAREALARHYWICAESDDPSHLIASHLERRGVTTVRLDRWGSPQLSELLTECFD